MGIYPEANLGHVHPPIGLTIQKAGRFLSQNDEKRLVALLHAVLQSHEDERFAWPKISRGDFTMSFFDKGEPEKTIISFAFLGDAPNEKNLKQKWFNLVLDDDEVFDVKVRILPPEVKDPSHPNWHALCLMNNVELKLAYATLVFLEVLRPHNKKLQACINTEKRSIMQTNSFKYATWCSLIEEFERCVRDALNGGIYAPAKANWGVWRIPQLYRDYCAYFKKEEEK